MDSTTQNKQNKQNNTTNNTNNKTKNKIHNKTHNTNKQNKTNNKTNKTKHITQTNNTNKQNQTHRISKINQPKDETANPVGLFINELIERYENVPLPEKFNYTYPLENNYYSRLLEIIFCGLGLRDTLTYRSRPRIRYKFDSDFTKNSEEVLIEDERFWGEQDTITCSKLPKGEPGYQITMVEFKNDTLNPNPNPCDVQVQLVYLISIIPKQPGHAIILLINHKKKNFSVIDPNGGGTKVDDYLDDAVFATMLTQIIGYKIEQIQFPPCQAVSTFPNSCMVWSQLFTELILRFGLENTNNYLEKNIKYKPTYESVISHRMSRNLAFAKNVMETHTNLNKIIKCFVIYMKACIDDVSGETWIYPPEYNNARVLRSKILGVARHISNLEIYTNRKKGEYIFFYYNKFWITIDANWDWILCFDYKYFIKSNEFNLQYFATLLAKIPEFRSLLSYLENTDLDKMLYLLRDSTYEIVQYLFPKKGYI